MTMASSRFYHKLTSSSVQSYSLSPPITDVDPLYTKCTPSSISVSVQERGEAKRKEGRKEKETNYLKILECESKS